MNFWNWKNPLAVVVVVVVVSLAAAAVTTIIPAVVGMTIASLIQDKECGK